MVRIWVGEDKDVTRATVCEFLEGSPIAGAKPQVEPFSTLGLLKEALKDVEAGKRLRPHVLLQDLQMGGGDLVDLATVTEGTNPTFAVIREFVKAGIPVIVLANLPAGVSREREPDFWSDIKKWTGAKWVVPKATYADRSGSLLSALEKILSPAPKASGGGDRR